MKKLFFVLFAAFATAGAMAQTTNKESMKDMRKDVKNVKTERRERNEAIAHGRLRTAKAEQKEVNVIRKDMHATKKSLKNKGVKHPVSKAKDQVKG